MKLSYSDRKRSLLGVIAAMAVVNLVYGVTFPLFALVLDAQGVSKTLIGLSTVAQAIAVVLIAPFTPQMLHRYRPVRLMQGIAVGLAAMFILAGWFPNVWFWFPLRLVIGAMTALLWIASEAVINDLAEDNWRGRVVAIYSSVGAAGFALAPLLLIFTGSSGMLPFVSTAAVTLLAALPLFWSVQKGTSHERAHQGSIWKVVLLAPAVMLANLAYAISVESISTFFPIFGLHLGLDSNVALGLMTVMGVGAMIMILPLGWLADHFDRRAIMLACVLLTMTGLQLMPFVIGIAWISGVFAFIFGGVSGMIYTLGVILIGEQFKGEMLARATTVFTACWGIGSVLGPLVVGAGMDWFGVEHMSRIIFVLFLPFLPFPVISWWRLRQRG